MTTATDMHDAAYLLSEIANGRTLFLSTCTRITKVDQRCVDRFARAGLPVLKNGSKTGKLLVASGSKYLDASLCSLELR